MIYLTRELKAARGHMMPSPVHFSDIRCKCFASIHPIHIPYRRCDGKQKGAMNEWTNEGVYLSC